MLLIEGILLGGRQSMGTFIPNRTSGYLVRYIKAEEIDAWLDDRAKI